AELARWKDEEIGVQKNRASVENYQAGSTFKPMVALAALENGLDPNLEYRVDENSQMPGRGAIMIGREKIRDTAPPGMYKLRRALARSRNSYFVQIGALGNQAVSPRVVDLGHRLHLGERVGLPLKQETAGHFPSPERVRNWVAGEKANICIGQGQ